MKIVIPAYEPDARVITLVQLLNVLGEEQHTIIVNDGSGEQYNHIFDRLRGLGCTVITHSKNLGKGAALRTAFNEIMKDSYQGIVVCADSDGQHSPEDIVAVARRAMDTKRTIVLGSRQFVGHVPFRSSIGNRVTRNVFKLATAQSISDTQTGLRAFSTQLLPWLTSIDGDRFQYEMNVLLCAHEDQIDLVEVPIETIYLEQNASSHFRPIIDSLLIYMPFLRFGAASFFSFIIDFVLLLLLQWATSNLLFSVIVARVCSSLINFALNNTIVFSRRASAGSLTRNLFKYYSLAAAILILNYVLLTGFTELLNVSLPVSKIITEITLFVISYTVQKKYVFNKLRKTI